MGPSRTTSNTRARIVLSVPTLPPHVLGPQSAPADYLDVDAWLVGLDSLGPYAFSRVEVDGGAEVDTDVFDGHPVPDIWVTSGGDRVHFRLRAVGVHTEGSPGNVRIVFVASALLPPTLMAANVDGSSEIVAGAGFRRGQNLTLVLPSGISTSEPSFFTGPSPYCGHVIVNADAVVHVGLRSPDASQLGESGSVCARWRLLRFDTWLDESVRDAVEGAPLVEAGAGRARVYAWDAQTRYAHIWFDPRGRENRLDVGRHWIVITWSTRAPEGLMTHRGAVVVVVLDDGTIELAAS